jgi:NAD(P)-dependent dehydrogenase (short-subunit alcohol dehydrogenase family)
MSTWLITGCSTGLGRHLAEEVLRQGHTAVVTARDVATVADFAERYPETALPVTLDVTDDDQIAATTAAALDRFDAVDVLVNNAGYGYRSAVEEGDVADVAQLFDTNFFGAVAMIKAVLPGMRERRSGAIVNISSIGAKATPAGSGYYAAAKSALEGLSGALAKEVGPLGIHVTAVEPGGFRTDFAGRSLHGSKVTIADYEETVGPRRKENDRVHGTQPGDPDKAAAAIITAVESTAPPLMLLLGEDAFTGYRSILTAQLAETDTWEQLSRGTGFDA